MRNKISLLSMKEINEFLEIATNTEGKIELYNEKTGYRVNGKSFLGILMASGEWGDDLWVESEKDIYMKIEKFIYTKDTATIHD